MQRDPVDSQDSRPNLPLRFLTLADTPPNPDSGASGTDVQTVRALRELGHHVDDVWSDALPHRLKHGNLHYAFELPRAYRAIVQQRLARKTYDVVLASQPHAYLAARWVRAHAKHTLFLNRSHGWEAHVEDTLAPHRRRLGVPRWSFPRGLMGRPLAVRLRRHCQSAADACHGLVVSATACRDYIVREHGIEERRVAVVPQATPHDYAESAVPFHTTRAAESVLLVSTPSFVKGYDDILAIIKMSFQRNLPLRFTWVVSQAAHASIQAQLGPSPSKRFTCLAQMSQSELRHVYDRHRIFLFPSLFEGFGKACVEAMSRALCVVASDVGGMRDLVEHNLNGYLCASGDREGFLESLVLASQRPSDAAEMGMRARLTVARLTWRTHAQRIVDFANVLRQRL